MISSKKIGSGCGQLSRGAARARRALCASFVAAAALLSAPVAWAANADTLSVIVTVKPVDQATSAPTVSVSRSGLSSFFSVKIAVKNGGTNTINKVVVKGQTTVFEGTNPSATLSADYAAFVNLGLLSPNCTQPTGPATNIATCTIGQLASQETRDFFLIFKAPTAGSSVDFLATTGFSSGNSDNTPPADFIRFQHFPVTLTTTNTTQVNHNVKTVLPPNGGDFFTGQDATTNSLNPFSTKVNVPQINALVTDNSIVEDVPAPGPCATVDNPSYFCFGFKSTIEVKNAADDTHVYLPEGASPILNIYLRQDVTALGAKPYPSIASIKIFYVPTTGGAKFEVKSCLGNPDLPKANIPCVAERIDLVKGNKGYYQYVIHAKDNGFYSW